MTLVAVVLVVALSPKSQNRLAIVPVDASLNVTTSGTGPVVGVPVKLATGTIAPVPVTVFVDGPPLAVLKITVFVNPPADEGLNRTTTLVEPPGGTLKVLPDTTLNGGPDTVAVPLLTVVPPLLVTVKTACELVPVGRVPKSRAIG